MTFFRRKASLKLKKKKQNKTQKKTKKDKKDPWQDNIGFVWVGVVVGVRLRVKGAVNVEVRDGVLSMPPCVAFCICLVLSFPCCCLA
jgi:hypothetical protein